MPHPAINITPPRYDEVYIDLFAGPGGWDTGILPLGIAPLGVEWDEDAANTARAAGHNRTVADVALLNPLTFTLARVIGLIASPPCFIAGTPVLTRRGSVSIENVLVGDEVWTHRNRWRRVIDVMSRVSETVRVGTITSTPDHPFYARPQAYRWDNEAQRTKWTLGEADWVHAAKLKGHFVASPLAVSTGPTDWACDPWLAGRYVADGWTGRDGVSIAVGAGKDDAFRSEVGDLAWTTTKSGPNCTRYTLSEHALATWLRDRFGHGAESKTIPTSVLGADEMARRRFLAGYLAGDGSLKRKKNGRKRWVANTVSAHLASQLRLLALSLGYASQIREVETSDRKVIEGREVAQRNYWSVTLFENDGRYTRDIDGLHWFKQRKDVTDAGWQTVYDITVDEDHSFVAWGYVVHNCQGFSIGGKGLGRKDSQMLLDGIRRLIANPTGAAVDDLIAELANSMHDARSLLVLQPLRWTLYMRPEWVAWEQVPAVQVLWDACAEVLAAAGYTVDTGVLNAEQYGVPQTRRRAILVGRSAQFTALHGPAALPTPTHSRFHSRTPGRIDEGVARWVTMADALGWGMTNRPYPTVSTGTSAGGTDPLALGGTQGRSIVYSAREAGAWVEKTWKDSPDRWDIKRRWTPGVDGRDLVMPLRPVAVDDELDAGDGQVATRNDGVRVTPQEAGVLQSFPADYPWSGGKSAQYRQASDAVPPLLARAVVAAVSGASTLEGVSAGVATLDAAA